MPTVGNTKRWNRPVRPTVSAGLDARSYKFLSKYIKLEKRQGQSRIRAKAFPGLYSDLIWFNYRLFVVTPQHTAPYSSQEFWTSAYQLWPCWKPTYAVRFLFWNKSQLTYLKICYQHLKSRCIKEKWIKLKRVLFHPPFMWMKFSFITLHAFLLSTHRSCWFSCWFSHWFRQYQRYLLPRKLVQQISLKDSFKTKKSVGGGGAGGYEKLNHEAPCNPSPTHLSERQQ